MKSIIAERFIHKGERRIALKFPYDAALNSVLKKFYEAKWSTTMNCWHIPDETSVVEKLPGMFGLETKIDLSGIKNAEKKSNNPDIKSISREQSKTITQPDFKPYTPEKTIVTTDNQNGSVTVKDDFTESKQVLNNYSPVEFTLNETDGKLIIRFTGRYDKEWIRELKSYGRLQFNPSRLEWVLSWTMIKVDSLSDYFASRGVAVIVKKYAVAPEVKASREGAGANIRTRILTEEILKGIENTSRFMAEKRYSSRTIETYVSLLELFFKYFQGKDPFKISEEDISVFFHDFIIQHGYSASYHNQLISAIKMFYQVNESRDIDSSTLVRPRRGRTLPKVFSKEEVKSILNASRNIKHRLILWMIYSCGLRRSELVNIRITDLDRSRGILNIRQAKGMIDRFIPVSDKVWEKLDEYVAGFEPQFWLFEGQGGGRYSSESVYRVFKEALKRAGIKKDVGVHSLRHSYATHLHENGVDIKYIQELLGHKSTRTTEIYTHVSRRNLVAVRSPIDDLDLK